MKYLKFDLATKAILGLYTEPVTGAYLYVDDSITSTVGLAIEQGGDGMYEVYKSQEEKAVILKRNKKTGNNTMYGTGEPPVPALLEEGTIYIKYI